MKIKDIRTTQNGRKQAKYEVIKNYLLKEFAAGNYKQGELLPSEKTLTEMMGVARNTVRQAIRELEEEGLVRRVQGKGSFFTDQINGNGKKLDVYSLIMPEINRGLYAVLTKGFDHQAGMMHHQVMVSNTDLDINKQGNIILQMIEKNVAGVALVPAVDPPTPAYHVRQMQKHGIPVVMCHRPVADVSAPLITWNAQDVGRLAGQALIEHGHRNIGYFAVYRYALTEAHVEGLQETLRAQGLSLGEERIYFGTSFHDDLEEQHLKQQALKRMMSGEHRVTGILCHDDNEAETLYFMATQMGIKVPQDLSIIGFGDCYARNGALRSRLTSVTVNEYELGCRAARMLNEMRLGQRPIDSDEVIYKRLILTPGETLAAIPAPKQIKEV